MDSGILRKDEESSSASPDTLRQAFRPLVFGSLDDRLLDALPGGIYFCDRDGALIRWNRRAVEFWGREPKPGDCNERFCGSYKIYRLDGSFVAHADCPMAEALRTGQPQRNIEGMVERPDGTRRIAIINIEIIQGDDGHLLGAVNIFHDITEQKQSAEALRKSEQGFRQLANAMPQIVWTAGSDGQIDYLNHRWTEFTGLPQTASNDAWAPLLHPSDAAGASARWAEALKSGQPFDMEVRLLDRRDGCYRWHLIRTVAARDEAGHVTRWFGTSTDIHEQKKAEESLRFLAQASAALAGLVDYERTLQKIANLAVPYFADWAAVDVQSEGRVRRIAVAHQDPQKLELAQELMRHYPPDLSAQGGIGAVFRTGEPEILSEITDDMLAAGAKDELHLTLLRSLALTSYICVPLAVGGEILGVLTFATAESKRRYSEDDLAMAKDLGRRAAIAIDNTRLYQTLQEADRKKDEFLATLAHELRNPLAPIHNSLQILRLPHIDSETAEQTRAMLERQVQHLARLVDDLLDVSRVMRGKIELRKERVEIATVVARALETVQPLITLRQHHFSAHLTSEAMPVHADPVRLIQVFANLLTNAAKYTDPKGNIVLTAGRFGDDAVIRVRDDGIGITSSMLRRIFELFVQADPGAGRSEGGLGIGLTLVQNIVQMHGGAVVATSDGLGKGSEFSVRLPICELPRSDETPLVAEARQPTHRSVCRILVVDDNKDAADSLAMLLKLKGHEVRVAYNGAAAIELANAYKPQVAFLDIGMPDMDGCEVARRLRAEPGLDDVILVALTGWGQQEHRRRTTEAGFDRHFVKPPDQDLLDRLLSELQ